MAELKKQRMEDLYRETFAEAIKHYGEQKFFFCGRKMYIRLKNQIIISVDWQGTETAFNNIVLMAIDKYGILDQNITAFKVLFKESKSENNGQEKVVSIRVALNATGEHTVLWSSPLTENDFMAINNFLMTYVDLFSAFTE
ncbi:hypothetical protein DW886_17220 [Enterocloster aldenensis]|uniref:hypothetical protein n=1 Tax=Enterocloster aldenensis TaxID=358742 RepID=UPI000E4727F3|nr:hypothetical protein DW886_17220 [Enterocloster aldenensis]